MSKKVTFFPEYRLQDHKYVDGRVLSFHDSAGMPFTTRIPHFGMTHTQKIVLDRLWLWDSPPVVSISHEKPSSPDKPHFCDPEEPHRTYYPYAMAIATVQCLGEAETRIIKVYFCYVELHEGNNHSSGKGVYVVAV